MSTRYEEIRNPRFLVTTLDGQEQITIPAERRPFIMMFLLVWLGGWTVGGWSAIANLSAKGAQPFLIFWLGGWALGEGFAIMALAWMSTGAETIRVIGGDLEIGYRMLGITRRKLYRGSEIRNLSSWTTPLAGAYNNQMSLPFLLGNKVGAIKFNYGPRSIYVAPGLDEVEGRMIVERLRRWLPPAASSPGQQIAVEMS